MENNITVSVLTIPVIGTVRIGDTIKARQTTTSVSRRWEVKGFFEGGIIAETAAIKNAAGALRPVKILFTNVKCVEQAAVSLLNTELFGKPEALDIVGDALEDLAARGWAQFIVRGESYVIAATPEKAEHGVNHGSPSRVYADPVLGVHWRSAGQV
jgi:hypothetical protein